jgi:RNA polymerase sigma factor (sigma-70 family)
MNFPENLEDAMRTSACQQEPFQAPRFHPEEETAHMIAKPKKESFPKTSPSLLSRLQHPENGAPWQQSWRLFLEIYKKPLRSMAAKAYAKYTGGGRPPQEFVEDVVSNVIMDVFTRTRFDPERGKFRSYLATLAYRRTVDLLRKNPPFIHVPLSDDSVPERHCSELDAAEYNQALLATMIAELRETIPHKWFSIFEQVKLLGIPPAKVAESLNESRSVVDNTVYKAMQKLREIAVKAEYQTEYYFNN